MRRSTIAVSMLAAAGLAVAPLAAPASAAPSGAVGTIVSTGLEGPRQLFFDGANAYVADSDDGQVRTLTADGKSQAVLSRLGSTQGVAVVGGSVLAAVGAAEPDEHATKLPPRGLSATVVSFAFPTRKLLSDPQRFELRHNPDGQQQFNAKGVPLDALSNPYYLLPDPHGYVLLADAGGNDILRINSRGATSLFAALPLITAGKCKTVPNNDKKHVGCDPVPTGMAWGPDGSLYVSALGSEVEGAVFQLDGRTGAVLRTWTGFGEGLTGVAVADDGTIYASELLHGAPEGNPPKGFDPSTVGRIVKVSTTGAMSYAPVPMPAGIVWHDGALYSTAWSIAGMVGMAHAGQVLKVNPSAFVAAS
ncbi:hypothetical protein CLV35_2012 [Motilibacter peucedani]|uniref:ScyD/ScyE family protein n=1 Tax=Motilibacter peucedani TaxID=598650 RepID=A0A420XQR1_9ACTN|nr:ScyD/ScyE family protein [Motilibacter peucedani]RKS75542.1 hypothetical protein CLV35_2012 [Motilibacter peucedani]